MQANLPLELPTFAIEEWTTNWARKPSFVNLANLTKL
jgi:hypothetical protein